MQILSAGVVSRNNPFSFVEELDKIGLEFFAYILLRALYVYNHFNFSWLGEANWFYFYTHQLQRWMSWTILGLTIYFLAKGMLIVLKTPWVDILFRKNQPI